MSGSRGPEAGLHTLSVLKSQPLKVGSSRARPPESKLVRSAKRVFFRILADLLIRDGKLIVS